MDNVVIGYDEMKNFLFQWYFSCIFALTHFFASCLMTLSTLLFVSVDLKLTSNLTRLKHEKTLGVKITLLCSKLLTRSYIGIVQVGSSSSEGRREESNIWNSSRHCSQQTFHVSAPCAVFPKRNSSYALPDCDFTTGAAHKHTLSLCLSFCP